MLSKYSVKPEVGEQVYIYYYGRRVAAQVLQVEGARARVRYLSRNRRQARGKGRGPYAWEREAWRPVSKIYNEAEHLALNLAAGGVELKDIKKILRVRGYPDNEYLGIRK